MRCRFTLLLPLLAAAPPSAAQTPAARPGWYLGGGADALRFGHTLVADGGPGVTAEVGPSGRVGLHLSLARAVEPWRVSLEAGWAEGHIEAGNEAVSVRDLTVDVTRYRLALGLSRHLAMLGSAGLALELGPTVDLWSVSEDSRVRAGAEGRVVLRVPVGRVELEHRIGVGISGSPIEGADVGPAADERSLRTLLVGLGLRAPL